MNRLLIAVVLFNSTTAYCMQTNWSTSGWDLSSEQECCTKTGSTVGCALTSYSLAKAAASLCCYNLHVLGAYEVSPVTGACCGTLIFAASATQGIARFKHTQHSCLYTCFCEEQQERHRE